MKKDLSKLKKQMIASKITLQQGL
ncbi:MAG: hypothetical protein JWQ09_1883, partial [Segetibacter sp.]|nr:hypothetical protein [Segetibacter sp.]